MANATVPSNNSGLPRRLRVFLCHSSGDKPAVRDLYQRLRAIGIEPWLDEEDLVPGQDWDAEIRKAVRRAHIVLVCLSRASITKAGYIQKEIRYVLDVADEQPAGTIFLVPLRLEECDVPERLARWHWVDLFAARGFERVMRALQHRASSLGIVVSPEQATPLTSTRGVGLFIDVDNLLPLIPRKVRLLDVLTSLRLYASRFGEVVCQWAAGSAQVLQMEQKRLEAARFNVRMPRPELRGKGRSIDFVLLEVITSELARNQFNVVIIVSGDSDYYEKVLSLLDSQYTVRIATFKQVTSAVYTKLLEERPDSGFYIDDLNDVLHFPE